MSICKGEEGLFGGCGCPCAADPKLWESPLWLEVDRRMGTFPSPWCVGWRE